MAKTFVLSVPKLYFNGSSKRQTIEPTITIGTNGFKITTVNQNVVGSLDTDYIMFDEIYSITNIKFADFVAPSFSIIVLPSKKLYLSQYDNLTTFKISIKRADIDEVFKLIDEGFRLALIRKDALIGI